MKARKKPIAVEVWEIPPDDGQSDTRTAPPPWIVQAVVDRRLEMSSGGGALVHTREGQMSAYVGDWIIQGVQGEIYPCARSIFEETYELL